MNNEMLEMIQGQIGYRFKNTDLLQQAFVRRSYSKENGGENNEVLEFIGDKALDFIIVKKLAEKYGCAFIDLQSMFDEAVKTTPAIELTGDGVHPTAKGHQLIKKEWLKTFDEITAGETK